VTTTPGADERRMRNILRARGVGPDAKPAAEPEPVAAGPGDWWDRLYLDEPQPKPLRKQAADPQAGKPKKPKKQGSKGKKKRQPRDPTAARAAWDSHPQAPRQSLADAWDRIPRRLKWLGYHAAAAYLGWTAGLVGWITYVTAWIAATGLLGVQACFWYAVGVAALLLHRRTRSWWWPVAWLAAVPASSTVVGVLLYGTGYHS
jgi:hypothetical protein